MFLLLLSSLLDLVYELVKHVMVTLFGSLQNLTDFVLGVGIDLTPESFKILLIFSKNLLVPLLCKSLSGIFMVVLRWPVVGFLVEVLL